MTHTDYDPWAQAYATANATGFFNAWYEKPAMLRLLGDVQGKRVLDVGCGPGATSRALAERGAVLTGFDLSENLITVARRQVPAADLRRHDLTDPLPWQANTFDVAVASLIMHYLPDWSEPLAELHRVLVPGGRLLVSVNHPGAFPLVHRDLPYFETTRYTEDYDFDGTTVDLTFFHRPLSAMAESFAKAGFHMVGIHEPPADPDTPADVLPPGLQPGQQFLGFLFFDLVAA